MTDAAITFRDLTLGYNSHPAVHHLNGVVRRGSLTAIVGANGSGKSTLMKGTVGILKPMAGTVSLETTTKIAYLPQQSEIDRSFPARVMDIVAMGLWAKRGLLGRHNSTDRKTVSDALQSVGLAGFEHRTIDTLSGGQLQRALFARVLVQDADVILLDEPFNAIDTKTVHDLIEVINNWHAAGVTVMLVAHDLELVRRHVPETILLARGVVAWGPTEQTLSAENMLKARRFDEAWDDDAPWCAPQGHDHSHDGHDHGSHAHDHSHHSHGHGGAPVDLKHAAPSPTRH